MAERFKPGQKAPVSGQYEIIGPRGGKIGKKITVIKGDPLPPARKSGQTYVVGRAGKARTLKRSIDPSDMDREKIRSVIRAIHVLPVQGGWEVKGRSTRAQKFKEQAQAISYARDHLKEEESQLIVHNRSGKKTRVEWYD